MGSVKLMTAAFIDQVERQDKEPWYSCIQAGIAQIQAKVGISCYKSQTVPRQPVKHAYNAACSILPAKRSIRGLMGNFFFTSPGHLLRLKTHVKNDNPLQP